MRLFFITIGPRNAPRLAFEAMAPDAETAHNQAFDLCESPDERVDVAPVPSEEELLAADVARNINKAARFHSSNDASALEDQVQRMHCVGGL